MFEDVAHILEQYLRDQTIPSGGWIVRLRGIHEQLGYGTIDGGCMGCVRKMMARLIDKYEDTKRNSEGRGSLSQGTKSNGTTSGATRRNKRSKS